LLLLTELQQLIMKRILQMWNLSSDLLWIQLLIKRLYYYGYNY